MTSLRSAVVGVGYLGRFHAQKHKSLGTLKYVCDSSHDRAEALAKELDCEVTSDPKGLIGKIDAVTIAADTRSHHELCKFFLNHDIHVLVEKPICTTAAEAEEVVQLAERRHLKLAVGHIERFNPAFVVGLKNIFRPQYIQIQRLAPFKPRSLSVDVVLDLMIHDLDLASTISGSKVRTIRAKGSKVITPFNDACDAWLEFENGIEAYLASSRVDQKTMRLMNVYDAQGIVQVDLGAQTVSRLEQASGLSQTPLAVRSFEVSKWDALQRETEMFFTAIENKQDVLVTGRQGLEALRSAEKILELTS